MPVQPAASGLSFVLEYEDEVATDVIAVTAIPLDGEGRAAGASQSLPFSAAGNLLRITIPASFNTLEEDEPVALRGAQMLITRNGAPVEVLRRTWTCRRSDLAVMVDSFVILDMAEMLADVLGLSGFLAADPARRRTALTEAFARMTRMTYLVPQPADRPPGCEEVLGPREFEVMDAESFLDLPAGLRQALRRAQVIEAALILDGDEAALRETEGIVAERIGESSTTYDKPGARIERGLSARTLRELTGLIAPVRLRLERS